MARIAPLSGLAFGISPAPPRRLLPTFQLAEDFDVQQHREDRVTQTDLRTYAWQLVFKTISSVPRGAATLLSWIMAAINSSSSADFYHLDSDSSGPNVYVNISAVPVPFSTSAAEVGEELEALQCGRESTVCKGDDIVRSDGSIWHIIQPVASVCRTEHAVYAAKYIPEAEADGLAGAMNGGLVLTEDKQYIPVTDIKGSVLVLTDLKTFQKISSRAYDFIFINRYLMQVVPAKAPRKPTGVFDLDCPKDRVSFKKQKVVKYTMTENMKVSLGASQLEMAMHGSQWISRACRARMTLSKKRAHARVVLRYFPEAAYITLLYVNFRQQKVPYSRIVRVLVKNPAVGAEPERWELLKKRVMVFGGWTDFPRKELAGQEGRLAAGFLEVHRNIVFDYVRDVVHGNRLIITFAYRSSSEVPATAGGVSMATDVATGQPEQQQAVLPASPGNVMHIAVSGAAATTAAAVAAGVGTTGDDSGLDSDEDEEQNAEVVQAIEDATALVVGD